MSKHNHKKKKKNLIVEEIDLEIKENSIKTPKLNIKTFPLTAKQKDFLRLALDKDTKAIFVNGVAGTTKSYCAIYAALRLYNDNPDLSIKYIRTIAESGIKSPGAIPGTLLEKGLPFFTPLYNKLEEMLSQSEMNHLFEEGVVEPGLINFLRGSSFRNSVVIVDETQNFCLNELITLITRLGEGSRLIFLGDTMQSDIGNKSGFQKFYNSFNTPESVAKGIHCFEFTEADIMRSEILKYIVTVLKKIKNNQ